MSCVVLDVLQKEEIMTNTINELKRTKKKKEKPEESWNQDEERVWIVNIQYEKKPK